MFARDESGSLTLEACVSVLAFLILTLLFASFFPMFMVQNLTAHALLETSQSLSVDAYASTQINAEHLSSLKSGILRLVGVADSNELFSTDSLWYKQDKDYGETKDQAEAKVVAAVKQRFVAYLGARNEKEASDILKQYKVEDGLDGVSFAGTEVKDGYLYTKITYTFHNDFSVLNFKPFEVVQTTKSKLWV